MDTNDKVCPACGAPSKPGDLFCLNCGAKLDFASGASPPSGGNVAPPSSGASFPAGTPSVPSSAASSAGGPPAGTTAAAPTTQNTNSAAYSAPQNQNTPSSSGYGASSAGAAGSSSPPAGGQPAPRPASGAAPSQPGTATPPAPSSATPPSTPSPGYGAAAQPGTYQQPTAQPNAAQQPPAAGYSPSQQQGYTAPGTGSTPPPAAGQQPAQYGQQPSQQYGQQGNAAYGNQPQAGYPSSGQPGQYPGYGAPPAKKKKSVVPIVIIAVVVAVIAIAVVLFFLLRGSGGKAEYNTLLENITSSTSTTQVASYQSELDTFKTEHPDLVDADLTALVTACVDYDEASDDEYRYTDMIYELERLESSTVPQVASCASSLLPDIESAYDDYLVYVEEEEAAASAAAASAAAEEAANAVGIDLASSPMPILGDGTGALSVMDGQDVFSINAQNTSDKTITYFEIVAFFYDANGNPINGTNGYTWEWKKDDSMTIAPGGDHVPERDGYWAINSHSDVAYVVPFVVYTVFDDGTTWGSELSSTDKAALADQLQPRANEIVAAAM